MQNNFFTGFVLAGGKSSRMGKDKAFLRFGGETFLERAVYALKETCGGCVKVVLNPNQKHFIEKLPQSVSCVFDIFENRGALGGIHAALKDCETDWAIILAVDLPFVTSETAVKLANIAHNSPKEISAIVPRQQDGKLQPLCAVYRVNACLPKLEELINEKKAAAVKDFLKIVPVRLVEICELATRKNRENLFLNINKTSDYEEISLI